MAVANPVILGETIGIKDVNITFRGDRLKETRLSRGLSQDELADLMEVHQPTIANWEKSRSEPNSLYLSKMSKVLGITVDYLLGLVDNPMERVLGISPLAQKIIDLMNNPDVPQQVKSRIENMIEDVDLFFPKRLSGDGRDK